MLWSQSLAVAKPWMYKENWTQHRRRGPIQSHVSCSVAPTAAKWVTSVSWAAVFWCRQPLTWIGIKWFNCTTLPDFGNVIGPNGSNSDSETDYFTEVEILKKMCDLQTSLLWHKSIGKILFGPCGIMWQTCSLLFHFWSLCKIGIKAWRCSWVAWAKQWNYAIL